MVERNSLQHRSAKSCAHSFFVADDNTSVRDALTNPFEVIGSQSEELGLVADSTSRTHAMSNLLLYVRLPAKNGLDFQAELKAIFAENHASDIRSRHKQIEIGHWNARFGQSDTRFGLSDWAGVLVFGHDDIHCWSGGYDALRNREVNRKQRRQELRRNGISVPAHKVCCAEAT